MTQDGGCHSFSYAHRNSRREPCCLSLTVNRLRTTMNAKRTLSLDLEDARRGVRPIETISNGTQRNPIVPSLSFRRW